jgi:predicted transposase/invertase (TIGR01784 family)
MARYLDPKNDLTFKRVFGENPDLLISFLNAVMPLPPDRHIISIEYLPSDLAPETPTKKYSIVDVRCKDNHKSQFIVEMQVYWTEAFYNRIVFNAGKAYVRQLTKGEQYHLLQPVYTLAILNENFDKKSDKFYHHFQIVNKENTDEVIPGLEFVLIELTEKFRPETMSDRRLAVLWLRFLHEVNENMKSLPPELAENKDISKAAEICEESAYTEGELAAYDKYWDTISIERTLRYDAIIEGEKGRAEGRAEGEAKGRAEGEAIGLEKGEVKLKKEKEKMVITAFKKGISIEDIAEITNHTPEQITEILKQNNLI